MPSIPSHFDLTHPDLSPVDTGITSSNTSSPISATSSPSDNAAEHHPWSRSKKCSYRSSKSSASSAYTPSFYAIIRNDPVTLLHAPYTHASFAAYLAQTFCIENLHFWTAVRKYKYMAFHVFDDCETDFCRLREPSEEDMVQFTRDGLDEVLENMGEGIMVGSMRFTFNTSRDAALMDSFDHAHRHRFHLLSLQLHHILKTYLHPGLSPREVNILSETREQVWYQVTTLGNFHPAVLKQARDQVEELMRGASFGNWCSQMNIKESGKEASCRHDGDEFTMDEVMHASSREGSASPRLADVRDVSPQPSRMSPSPDSRSSIQSFGHNLAQSFHEYANYSLPHLFNFQPCPPTHCISSSSNSPYIPSVSPLSSWSAKITKPWKKKRDT